MLFFCGKICQVLSVEIFLWMKYNRINCKIRRKQCCVFRMRTSVFLLKQCHTLDKPKRHFL